MKKIFNKEFLIFFICFLALFSLALYTYIYTKTLFDYKSFGLDNIRCKTIWLGFSLSWIFLILFLVYLFSKKNRLRILSILIFLFNVVFVGEISYVQQLGKYLVVPDLFLIGEGTHYLGTVILNMDFGMFIVVLFNILCLFAMRFVYKKKDNQIEFNGNIRKIIIVCFIISIVVFRLFSIIGLGRESKDEWKEIYNTRSIYENYNNPNTAVFVSGFYEYHVRAIWKYFYEKVTFNDKALRKSIDNYNKRYKNKFEKNEYTGIFRDKNVIYIMMESIDSWIVDENTMPNLKMMMDTGINFRNRYSPFFNGGQTLNTEFALNTGLYSISDKKNIQELDYIDYDYSLANMLKKNGYVANSFHANKGSFYNRSNFHLQLGYDNHYSALDLVSLDKLDKDKDYFMDSVLLSDDDYMDLFIGDNKFLSFFTTYSGHFYYMDSNDIYKASLKIEDLGYAKEEYIYRVLAHDTDRALGMLLDKLKKTNHLDDTVLVLVSDHYSYGYNDREYVASKKGVENNQNLLQNTPFVIWSNSIEHKDVDIMLDTVDILPTVLNMLGIKYKPNKYLGTDVFSKKHDEFVWFNDETYIKSKTCKLKNEEILVKSKYNIEKNRNILLTNYYGK